MVIENLLDISAIRILGFSFGCGVILILFFKLRNFNSKRSSIWPLLFLSIAIILVSLSPNLLNIPSQVLSLYDSSGGRIITFVIFLSAAFFILLLIEIDKSFKRDKNLEELHNKLVTNDFLTKYHLKDLSYEIVIVIPAFNEEKNLGQVLDKIPSKILGKSIGVVVIDDGSNDKTGKVVSKRDNVFVASHLINRGGGAALRIGYEIAGMLEAQTLVTMDADGQHKPDEIEILVKPIINKEADIVIGSRFLEGKYSGSLIRIIGIKLFNTLIKTLLGVKISDCTSGFRAFDFNKLIRITLKQDQYHTSELLIDAIKRGFVVMDVPVNIIERQSGKSKKGSNFYYGFSFLKTIIITWLR
jgi:hypothetical protein